jgi:hypothetical protein
LLDGRWDECSVPVVVLPGQIIPGLFLHIPPCTIKKLWLEFTIILWRRFLKYQFPTKRKKNQCVLRPRGMEEHSCWDESSIPWAFVRIHACNFGQLLHAGFDRTPCVHTWSFRARGQALRSAMQIPHVYSCMWCVLNEVGGHRHQVCAVDWAHMHHAPFAIYRGHGQRCFLTVLSASIRLSSFAAGRGHPKRYPDRRPYRK